MASLSNSVQTNFNFINKIPERMKIGILTLPLHSNYGGVLQAWALQTVLKRMGHEVDVFGRKYYHRHSRPVMPLVWVYRLLLRFIGRKVSIFDEIRVERAYNRRNARIQTFIRHNIHTRYVSTLSKILGLKYNAIVVGSDQIWRKDYIRHVWKSEDIPAAFLSNYQYTNTIKIAYAASLGIDNWDFTAEETEKIKTALATFKKLSVREKSAIEILKDSVGIKPALMIDPTMLITPDEYVEELGIEREEKDLAVSYILDPSSDKTQLIREVTISRHINHKELNRKEEDIPAIGIEEWVESIANANIVITDSFHGCVFSLIFNKPLIFIKNEKRGNSRFDSLVSLFDLSANCLSESWQYNPSLPYTLPEKVMESITIMRENSFSFLKNALK